MKHLVVISLFFAPFISTNGQTVLIGDITPADLSFIDNNYGPNRKFFIYNYIGCGVKSKIINTDNEIFLPLRSNFDMKLGSRARFGIGKLFGLIYDIELNSSWNKLLQTVDSIMPISVINLKKAKYISSRSYDITTNPFIAF